MSGSLQLARAANGSEDLTCDADNAGRVLYSTTDDSLRLCKAGGWGAVSSAGGGDTPPPVSASEYVQFYVGPAGSDSATCLSRGAACQTIQHALSLAPDYGAASVSTIVYVAPGTYAESLSLPTGGERRVQLAVDGAPASGHQTGATGGNARWPVRITGGGSATTPTMLLQASDSVLIGPGFEITMANQQLGATVSTVATGGVAVSAYSLGGTRIDAPDASWASSIVGHQVTIGGSYAGTHWVVGWLSGTSILVSRAGGSTGSDPDGTVTEYIPTAVVQVAAGATARLTVDDCRIWAPSTDQATGGSVLSANNTLIDAGSGSGILLRRVQFRNTGPTGVVRIAGSTLWIEGMDGGEGAAVVADSGASLYVRSATIGDMILSGASLKALGPVTVVYDYWTFAGASYEGYPMLVGSIFGDGGESNPFYYPFHAGEVDVTGLFVAPTIATSDTISIVPTTGGAARFSVKITNADMTAARTQVLPNASGDIAVCGTPAAAVAEVSTHKIPIVVQGTTYYILATTTAP